MCLDAPQTVNAPQGVRHARGLGSASGRRLAYCPVCPVQEVRCILARSVERGTCPTKRPRPVPAVPVRARVQSHRRPVGHYCPSGLQVSKINLPRYMIRPGCSCGLWLRGCAGGWPSRACSCSRSRLGLGCRLWPGGQVPSQVRRQAPAEGARPSVGPCRPVPGSCVRWLRGGRCALQRCCKFRAFSHQVGLFSLWCLCGPNWQGGTTGGNGRGGSRAVRAVRRAPCCLLRAVRVAWHGLVCAVKATVALRGRDRQVGERDG